MYSPRRSGSLWLPLFVLLISCSPVFFACSSGNRLMNKGLKQLAKKEPEKAAKTFSRLKNDPVYDLAAEYHLLGMSARKGKKLRDWYLADSAYEDLGSRLSLASPEKKRALKAYKLSERSVANKRIRYERKAFQLVEQTGSVILLDSVDKMFLPWVKNIVTEWDTVRARVVNRNLPTKDYDVATSILNHHEEVVYRNRYPHFWALQENIWDLFIQKYPRCRMDRFKADHPGHYYSRDCWFEEAREMFCQESLGAALEFLDRYPYSVLELEVQDYIEAASRNKQAVASLLPAEQKHLEDLELFHQLREIVECGSPDTATLKRDLYFYLQTYAPRYTAFILLKRATNYYLQTNQPSAAFHLLTDMRGIFRDSAVCATAFDFQTQKQAWFQQALECLEDFAERPIPHYVRRWNTSKYKEYSAVSWDEGTEVYFARKEGKQTWVMRSTLENDDWSPPQRVEQLSIGKRASPMSLTADGLEMLLKAGRFLYISTRADESAAWAPPQRLGRAFPAMSRAVLAPDGSAILLDASYDPAELWEKPVGNLYFCERDEEGNFKKPKSLGATINTRKGREANPFLCADGKTLLFCSDGRGGFGKLDVFMSRRKGDSWTEWTEPQSLGCPINSLWDDFGFTWVPEDGRGAFFTEKGYCDEDLDVWQTDLPAHARPQPRTQLRGKVLDSSGKPLAKGEMEISINGAPPFFVPIGANGTYRYMLPDSANTVEVYAAVPGFYTSNDATYQVKGMPRGIKLRDTFQLRSIPEIRKSFTLRYATFDEGRVALKDMRVYKELALLHRFAQNTKVNITLVCHTDDAGTEEQNMKLSNERAELLRKILIDSFKMSEKALSIKGKGKSKPLFDHSSESNRQANQRVEVEFEFPFRFETRKSKPGPVVEGPNNKNNTGNTQQKNKKNKKSKPRMEEISSAPKKKKKVIRKLFGWMMPRKNKEAGAKEEGVDEGAEGDN